MFEDTLHSSQGLDHVGSVVVEVPQLSVVTLVGPPEGILLQYLVLFELGSDSPSLVIGQGMSVLLEEGIDPGNTSIPRVFQVLKGQTPRRRKNYSKK